MVSSRAEFNLTTKSLEAAKLYNESIELILGSQSGADKKLDEALKLDPHFSVAAAARYYIAKDVNDPNASNFREQALNSITEASLVEQEHVNTLFGIMENGSSTLDQSYTYIKNHPKDMFIISQLAGHQFFYGGPKKLEIVQNIFESVKEENKNDWAFLARLGFALSEAGNRKKGKEFTKKALEIHPPSLYSIHALAHVLHDDGAAQESAELLQEWLQTHESTASEGQMFGHVQWHLALAEAQIGEHKKAMHRYLKYCAPETTTCGPVLTLADCGGFLLRDYLISKKAKNLPSDVLSHIERVWPMIGHPFIALHVAGLYASANDLEGLNRCQETLLQKDASHNRDTSICLVNALSSYVVGDYSKTISILSELPREIRIGIGGSNVERELVDLIEQSAKEM